MGIIESMLQPKKEQTQKISYDKELTPEEKEFNDLIVKTSIYCGDPIPPPDFSHAISIVIDGPCLKLRDEPAFNYLLPFVQYSRRWYYLEPFRDEGNSKTAKVYYTGEELEAIDAFRDSATTAIDQYNNIIKKQKLKLEKLLKVISDYNRGPLLYMTISAIDIESGTTAEYFVAILELRGRQLLGLLTDSSTKKNLFVLTLSGAGCRDLVVKEKIPITDVLPTVYEPVRAQLLNQP